jgi:hypothetical protein
MTQRTEARFKVFNRANKTIREAFEYDNIDFNVGGTYDTTTYEYTFENAGTYLMGYSYSKKSPLTNNNFEGQSNVQLTRGGTTYTISHLRLNEPVSNTTISNCFVYRFEVDDRLQIVAVRGQPKMDAYGYGGDSIFNSWWGIKLNY